VIKTKIHLIWMAKTINESTKHLDSRIIFSTQSKGSPLKID